MANNSLAVIKKDIDNVLVQVQHAQANGSLVLPPKYSAGNAIKAAWLQLQNVKDRNDKPALEVCTQNSIRNAMFDMVVQALNPNKKQCYFVVYGNQLTCQRSYFGSQSVAKMVKPEIAHITAQVVYQDDEFEYEFDRAGRKRIISHRQKLTNIDPFKIVAAYCVITDKHHNVIATDIMTFDEIKQAWRMSKTRPVNEDGSLNEKSTHAKHTADMAKKTVIGRTCKPIINSSDDETLFISATRADSIQREAEIEEEREEYANGEVVDFVDEEEGVVEIIEPEPAPKPEPKKEKSAPKGQTSLMEEDAPY